MDEVSAGGVVYSTSGSETSVLLILDIFGSWSLPKGHVEPGETLEETAIREIEEEVGIKGDIEEALGEVCYQFTRDLGTIQKTVHYFLIKAAATELRMAEDEVLDAKWVPLGRVLEASDYRDNRDVLEKAVALLKKQAGS
ncbi:MAG: NUDIX hydrolase [Dehalococcoidia bacterium]|nr:NUDIX hydrolase [Dehalococcoidia bacterium]